MLRVHIAHCCCVTGAVNHAYNDEWKPYTPQGPRSQPRPHSLSTAVTVARPSPFSTKPPPTLGRCRGAHSRVRTAGSDSATCLRFPSSRLRNGRARDVRCEAPFPGTRSTSDASRASRALLCDSGIGEHRHNDGSSECHSLWVQWEDRNPDWSNECRHARAQAICPDRTRQPERPAGLGTLQSRDPCCPRSVRHRHEARFSRRSLTCRSCDS